ncbi:CheR family methyltransferase [Natranaerofaba carboxydovora]|uniref:CheR family methyltransferase n=1 Tax=Natranaerofaba carboxydovora TaxID=2742683 RepID=UPI001F146D18|nr:protein-glutamate O-methyltransferase CheR [Natranaerofaba carboxydovora]UMZ73583.1 Chemotaxis protein methyltransferase [Natranaerofaba carboxydovora]
MTTDAAFENFKKQVYNKTGIDLNQYKEKQMKRRLNSLMRKRGFDKYEDYWEALRKDQQLYQEFLDRLTINVSEFFRNADRWSVLENEMLPKLLENSNDKSLKVWSAGCSTGEEPYTLVMVMSKFLPFNKINVYATDIDEMALKKAKEGLYPQDRVKGVKPDYIDKYFTKEGNNYRIDKKIRDCVAFEKQNMLEDKFDHSFDLILCRNVMIYFTEEAKKELYKKFYDALKKGGILFVGSTEQIFDARKLGFKSIATFFYQK